MLCCSTVVGPRGGSAQRLGFNCPPRSPPARHRWRAPPAPGNTPGRSWRGIGSGAAASPRCGGSVPRLGRSVEKWIGAWCHTCRNSNLNYGFNITSKLFQFFCKTTILEKDHQVLWTISRNSFFFFVYDSAGPATYGQERLTCLYFFPLHDILYKVKFNASVIEWQYHLQQWEGTLGLWQLWFMFLHWLIQR